VSDFENPLAINDVAAELRRDKVSCLIPHKSTVLIIHRHLPVSAHKN
jgi:hypothetical protein